MNRIHDNITNLEGWVVVDQDVTHSQYEMSAHIECIENAQQTLTQPPARRRNNLGRLFNRIIPGTPEKNVRSAQKTIETLLKEKSSPVEKAEALLNYLLTSELPLDKILNLKKIDTEILKALIQNIGKKMLYIFTPREHVITLFNTILNPLYALQDEKSRCASTWFQHELFLLFRSLTNTTTEDWKTVEFLHNLAVYKDNFHQLTGLIQQGRRCQTDHVPAVTQDTSPIADLQRTEYLCNQLEMDILQIDFSLNNSGKFVTPAIEILSLVISNIYFGIVAASLMKDKTRSGHFMTRNANMMATLLATVSTLYKKIISFTNTGDNKNEKGLITVVPDHKFIAYNYSDFVTHVEVTEWQGIKKTLRVPQMTPQSKAQFSSAFAIAGFSQEAEALITGLDRKLSILFDLNAPATI